MNTKKTITDHLQEPVSKVLDLGAGTGLELIYLFAKYPNAQVKTASVEKETLIDPTALLEQRRKAASAFNEIASQFRTANTGYSKAGIGNSYGMAGSRFDAFA